MGAVSALGLNVQETLESFEKGERYPTSLSLFESPVKYPVFEAKRFAAKHPYSDGVRTLELTLQAVSEALESAKLDKRTLQGFRVGICLGTTVASQLNDLEFYRKLKKFADGCDEPLPSMAPVQRYLKTNLAEAVAESLGIYALTATITNACSSGADAIGAGAQWIEAGLCDLVIAGGADELNQIPYCGFYSLGLGSQEPCKPFDRQRRGLNLGEGAGIVILEHPQTSSRRGITPEIVLRGYGTACDAHHLTAPCPHGSGLRSAIVQAMRHAKVTASDVAFINAHGTGTQENDRIEGNALFSIFGDTVPFLSTKGFTGHTLGAAGGLEAVFTALGLREGWIPGSIGFAEPDEAIPFQPVRMKTRITGRVALSTSLAFGGNNAALLLGIPS